MVRRNGLITVTCVVLTIVTLIGAMWIRQYWRTWDRDTRFVFNIATCASFPVWMFATAYTVLSVTRKGSRVSVKPVGLAALITILLSSGALVYSGIRHAIPEKPERFAQIDLPASARGVRHAFEGGNLFLRFEMDCDDIGEFLQHLNWPGVWEHVPPDHPIPDAGWWDVNRQEAVVYYSSSIHDEDVPWRDDVVRNLAIARTDRETAVVYLVAFHMDSGVWNE
jgi:hypothetical protein